MQHEYFAASNSSEGFKSYYPEVFGRADRLYVIKGGPGTGKSGLIKKCAESARVKGREVEYYFCSSDPRSLDGALICAEESVGIIDGTAPHVWEPTCPGAREEIVNLGQFWDIPTLREHEKEIRDLTLKKSRCFEKAYRYLSFSHSVSISAVWNNEARPPAGLLRRDFRHPEPERTTNHISSHRFPDNVFQEIPPADRCG